VTLIAEKIAKGSRGRFGGDPGRSLGEHPDKGGAVLVKNGRYGPYVTHDGINATLPSDKTPDTITLDEAVGLIAARAERTGGKPARPAKGGNKGAKSGAAEKPPAKAAKPKPAAAARGKAKPDGASAPDHGAASKPVPTKPKAAAPAARAKATKTPVKPVAKPAPEPAAKRAKAGK
jgi:DNA topoisomerase-1